MIESRVRLEPRDPRAFDILLGEGRTAAEAHRLVWTLFPDQPQEGRSFLFDVISRRPFSAFVRSAVAPSNGLGAWRIESRPMDVRIEAGMRLAFRVKCVASANDRVGEGRRGRRRDVARHFYERHLTEERRRALSIGEISELASLDWLERQGSMDHRSRGGDPLLPAPPHGFALERDTCRMVRTWVEHARKPRGAKVILTAYDLRGILEVTDPTRFRRMLLTGIGRGRSYGFGLMHVHPAGAGDPADATAA